jgi:hypothetical protein
LWLGPQFFNGQGRDELRQALRQQNNFKEKAMFAWNEVVLDGKAHNSLMQDVPSELLTAFWYPKHRHCRKDCQSLVYKARDRFFQKYGVNLPVLMIDVHNGSAPFLVASNQTKDEDIQGQAGIVESVMV